MKEFPKTATAGLFGCLTMALSVSGMTPGANFWNIGWEGWQDFFVPGLNWSTTTNPWNPTLISELQEAQIKCLRFMDWNLTNDICISDWSDRIPKTADHYNNANKVWCWNHSWDGATNTHTLTANGEQRYGVAYEWQIDLCNRIGADIWINLPMNASGDYLTQLATLLKSQLDPSLKIYIEWANETWNFSFSTCIYAWQKADQTGVTNIDVGAYCEPWWKYTVYASVRAFERFEAVFGADSPRLVKVLGGQVGYHWPNYDYNHMVKGMLAALANSTINPNHVTINAFAMAPYCGGSSISEERSAIAEDAQGMLWAKNSLANTGISLICYEGGADNYPDNGLALTHDPAQEQLYVDYLTALEPYCDGVFNQYCFYGACWGLKKQAGEAASVASKWRGWLRYWNDHPTGLDRGNAQRVAPGSAEDGGILRGEVLSVAGRNGACNVGISVVDLFGRTVPSTPRVQTGGFGVSGLSGGAYIFRIISDGGRSVGQFTLP